MTRQNQLAHSFLGGRDAGQAVDEERELVTLTLIKSGLVQAAQASSATKSQSANFWDFYKMRGAMLAGGLHRVRLRGGRNINGD